MIAWTDTQVAELRRMWIDEGMSGGQIAEKVGRSRCSVLGKVQKLQLERAPQINARNKQAANQEKLRARLEKVKPAPKPAPKPKALGGTTSGAMIANAALKRIEAEARIARAPIRVDDPFRDQPGSVGLNDLARPEICIHCRWPFDVPGGETRFCGDAREDFVRSYCAAHNVLASGRGTQSERRAAYDGKRAATREAAE